MKYKDLEIYWLGHSGFKIKSQKIIYIDPFKINSTEPADFLFITHSHYDHFSIEDIRKIYDPKTIIIGPTDILGQLRQIGENVKFEMCSPGRKLSFENLNIECISAYNLNKQFHPIEEDWMGFVLEVGETRIYHTGDSDFIPEMRNVNSDIMLVPVSGKYVMNVDEAIKAVELVRPKLAIPMHYGEIIGSKEDAEKFAKGCKEVGILCTILEKEKSNIF